MPDFSKARKGDPCFCVYGGDVENGHNEIIVEVSEETIRLSSGLMFSIYGHAIFGSAMPLVFHSKPSYDDPPPPKRMVKKWVAMAVSDTRDGGGVFVLSRGGSVWIRVHLCNNTDRVITRKPDWAHTIRSIEVEVPEE